MSFLKYVAIASVTLAALSLLYNAAYGSPKPMSMYEDQLMLCNFENNCMIIDADDFISERGLEDIWISFNNNLDTFDLSDAQ